MHVIVTEEFEEEFDKHASINVLLHAELWSGKICAALDRQHQIELFDVKELTGVKWKLFNINKLKNQNPDKYLEQHSELSRKLYEK